MKRMLILLMTQVLLAAVTGAAAEAPRGSGRGNGAGGGSMQILNEGIACMNGDGVDQDYEKAFRYFSIGAHVGHLESMYKIGDMYLRGQYVDKDEEEAFVIYNRCFQMMSDDDRDYIAGPLHLRLGNMYLDGIGTNQDAENALFHYSVAEVMLYRMVRDGNYMYKKSLRLAIEGQAKARALLSQNIPLS